MPEKIKCEQFCGIRPVQLIKALVVDQNRLIEIYYDFQGNEIFRVDPLEEEEKAPKQNAS